MAPPRRHLHNKKHRHRIIFASIIILLLILVAAQLKQELFVINHSHQKAVEIEANKVDDPNQNPVQVAFGLSGNHPGFLSEFEVALKSVLLSAPLERNLSVHILADQEAFVSLKGIFNRTELSTWQTRNPTEIHAYDVTPDHPQMKHEIEDVHKPHFPNYVLDVRHTMGAFYRLFVDRYVSKKAAKHILYMDTDVVVMANLEALWKLVEHQERNVLFHWGKTMCSGFVVMNLQRMKEILTLAKRSNFTEADGSKLDLNSDQTIYQAVNISYPNEVNVLPPGWDMTVTNIWQSNNHPYDKNFPNVGMLHFNGGGSTQGAYFGDENGTTEHNFITNFKDTWGNGKFYATLPWEWARYQAMSLVRPGSKGHSIQFYFSKGMQGAVNVSESERLV